MDACIRKGESPVLFSKYAVFDERARNSCRRQEKGALAEGKKRERVILARKTKER